MSDSDQHFLEQLARHVSHQLNNPIASIGSAAYLIEDILSPELSNSEAIQSSMPFVASIREDAGRLKDLVDELRRYFVLGNFLPAKVDLSEFLRVRTARSGSLGLAIDFEAPAGVSLASELDLGLMQSAFELLLKELSGRGVSSMKMEEMESGTMNVIRFTMPAINGTAAEQASAFYEPIPFAAGQGLGLTLPYIRRVIELHSGTVKSESGVDGNFIIEISLPKAQ